MGSRNKLPALASQGSDLNEHRRRRPPLPHMVPTAPMLALNPSSLTPIPAEVLARSDHAPIFPTP